jgi:hypothetical protein
LSRSTSEYLLEQRTQIEWLYPTVTVLSAVIPQGEAEEILMSEEVNSPEPHIPASEISHKDSEHMSLTKSFLKKVFQSVNGVEGVVVTGAPPA